jgi:hypothetical protein
MPLGYAQGYVKLACLACLASSLLRVSSASLVEQLTYTTHIHSIVILLYILPELSKF